MGEEELEFLPWIIKINEKLTFAILNVKDHRDISEEDYAILYMLYKLWWLGEHPLYKPLVEQTVETSVQQGLFAESIEDTDLIFINSFYNSQLKNNQLPRHEKLPCHK